MTPTVARWPLVVMVMLLAAMGCSRSSAPTADSDRSADYVALEAEIDRAITTGPPTMANMQAVLVSVDGETKIAHYRHGFTGNDHRHVFSVTKSVISLLIGIAIADGLIASIDQPLAELLPDHRRAMSEETGKVTLGQLMSMSGGFNDHMPVGPQWDEAGEPGGSYVDLLLQRRPDTPGTNFFFYSNPSAHLAAAVLEAALQRADGDRPRTVLGYAREKVFDPLGISTRPAFSRPLPDLYAPEFAETGFGWATDPNGIEIGAAGLRLTAPDMIKIGELYLGGGVWDGQQIVPADWIRESTAPSASNPGYGLFWWLISEPGGPGYTAAGAGEQHITVLPEAQAVVVYLADVRRDSEITAQDVDALNAVFVAAFGEQ